MTGMELKEIARELLQNVGPGKMSSLAYDTAWVAQLGEHNWDLSASAINWLCDHQLSDGSWGAKAPFYYHDRVISTLAAMIALTYRGRRASDREQIEKGLIALENITGNATKGLSADPNGATVGFEMIVPTLVQEAENLGIIKQQGNRILGRMKRLREVKMSKLAGMKINRHITPAFSSEMAGRDFSNILDIEMLQESNGSVANSPSATAYYIINLKPNDYDAMDYLRSWVLPDGGTPNVAPFDIFEPAWVLWNLKLAELTDDTLKPLYRKQLDFIKSNWKVGCGIGHASEYTPKDSDDSSLVLELMEWFDEELDIEAILKYEEEKYFRCFALEANPSISANIHVLGALQSAKFSRNHHSIQKVIGFLENACFSEGYWLDKWHASPYYATSHAIIIGRKYNEPMFERAVNWILRTQNSNGSWGYYSASTAEESAYCLQAISVWNKEFNTIPKEKIILGYSWLRKKLDDLDQTPLWIGKGLYCPELVVKATIVSALALAEKVIS